jgi:F0F1-type ATP synthase alpha subunit
MTVFLDSKHPQILEEIRTTQELSDELRPKLDAALDAFAEIFEPSRASE